MSVFHFRMDKFARRRLTVLVVLLVIAAGVYGSVAHASASGPVATKTVTVYPGQSLWSLAEAQHLNRDPRDWIADVVTLNHLSSSLVSPGQNLVVPVQ
jgi:LysM repeat protein